MTRRRSWPADPEQARATLHAELGPAWRVSYTAGTRRFRAERGHASVEATDPAAVCAAVDAYFDGDHGP